MINQPSVAPTRTNVLPRDLPSLTSLRSFAALFVFVCHLYSAEVISLPSARFGYTGVAFFFVLSGFVLTWGYSTQSSSRRFYLRRLARIYPSHVVMWLVVLLVPSVNGTPGPLAAVLNLLLLQAWPPSLGFAYSLNGVAWSLSCEIAFYAVFPTMLNRLSRLSVRGMWIVGFSAFAAASVFVIATSGDPAPTEIAAIRYVNPVVRFPEFLLGIIAALALRSGWRPHWAAGAVILLICGAGFVVFHDDPAADVWAAPVYLVVIVAFVLADISRPIRLLGSRPLVYAGKVSFCFYLVHQVVIRLVVQLHLNTVVTIGSSLALSCVLAMALHHGIEHPAHGWIVTRFDARKKTTPSNPSAE